MDTKINSLEYHVLEKLSKMPLTGYELSKEMEGSYVRSASHQQLYKLINKLHGVGYLSCVEEEQKGKPNRKRYSAITEKVRPAIKEFLLHTAPNIESVHSVHTIMIQSMEQKYFRELIEMLDVAIDYIKEQLNEMESTNTPGAKSEKIAMGRAIDLYEVEKKFCKEVLKYYEEG